MTAQQKTRGTALITGGSRRIGRAICLHLYGIGFRIALHYNKSKKEALSLKKQIEEDGGNCQLFNCDLNKEKATQKLISQVVKKCPDLNLLINNASIFKPSNLKSASLDSYNTHMNIHLKAAFILTKEFAIQCKKGHIINMLDRNITKNKTDHFTYLLSKKGILNLTELSAVELAPHIRVNAISPGAILPPEKKTPSYMDKLKPKIPLKITGSTESVTRAIEYLIKNPFITGENLFVDGGEHLL